MDLMAKNTCFCCGNRLGLQYFEPLSKHGSEHGFNACPKHRADAYKRQALEDMGHGEEYEAYCKAMRNLADLYSDKMEEDFKKRGGGLKKMEGKNVWD